MSALHVPHLWHLCSVPCSLPHTGILTHTYVGLSVGSDSWGEALHGRWVCSQVFLCPFELWLPLKFSWSWVWDSCLTFTGRKNLKYHRSISIWNGSSRLGSWAANIHDRVFLLIEMISLPGWGWGSLDSTVPPPAQYGLSLSSLMSGHWSSQWQGPQHHTMAGLCWIAGVETVFPHSRLILLLPSFLFFCCVTPYMGSLVPQPGIEPVPPAVEAWSLNH